MKHQGALFFTTCALVALASTAAVAAESVRVDVSAYVHDSFLLRQPNANGPASLTNLIEGAVVSTRPMGGRVFKMLVNELRVVMPVDGGSIVANCPTSIRIAWSTDSAKPRVAQFCAQGDAPGTAGLRAWYRDVQPLR